MSKFALLPDLFVVASTEKEALSTHVHVQLVHGQCVHVQALLLDRAITGCLIICGGGRRRGVNSVGLLFFIFLLHAKYSMDFCAPALASSYLEAEVSRLKEAAVRRKLLIFCKLMPMLSFFSPA